MDDEIAADYLAADAPLSPGLVETMMACLLRSPGLAAAAAGQLDAAHFRGDEAGPACLWSVVSDLTPGYPDGIPYQVAWEATYERANSPARGVPPEVAATLVDRPEDLEPEEPGAEPGLIYRAYHGGLAGADAARHGLQLLRRFLVERAALEPLRRALAPGDEAIPANLGQVVERVGERLGRIESLGRRPRPMSETFAAFESDLDAGLGRPFLGLRTRLAPLDERTGGLRGTTILGAPPNTGKTVLLTQLAIGVAEAAEVNGAVVVLVCLDMAAATIWRRIVSHVSGLPYRTVVQGSPALVGRGRGPYRTEEDQAAYDRGRVRLLGGIADRLVVLGRKDVGDGLTAAGLRQLLARAKEATGMRRALLAVDYLQLLPVPRDVAAQGELSVAKFQVRMVQEAVEPPEGVPEWEQDAALVVSETRKRVPGEKAASPLTNDDLMGSSRLAYSADCVLLLGPLPGPALAGLHGLAEKGEEQRAALKALRDEYERRREVPMALEISKARDGMFRGTIALSFGYDVSRMDPIEPAGAPAAETAPAGAAPGHGRGSEAGRKVLAALRELDGDESGGPFSLNAVARAADNMNKAKAKAALARLVDDGRVEAIPDPASRRGWTRYRAVAAQGAGGGGRAGT
jgi:hypothetical protein